MGSSWTGFQPQNELVKLQWAVLEIAQFEITEREINELLSISDAYDKGGREELAEIEGSEPPDP